LIPELTVMTVIELPQLPSKDLLTLHAKVAEPRALQALCSPYFAIIWCLRIAPRTSFID